MKRDFLYSVTCLAFAIIIGGAVYEHVNIVPVWSAAAPASLAMFQGEYGLKPELFWMAIHPVTLILFVLTLFVHWKSARRKTVAIVLAGYMLILIVTSIYFVPELISIITSTFSEAQDPELTERARLWEVFSLIRLAILIILALLLFTGLTKPNYSTAASPKYRKKNVNQLSTSYH